jgi:hypothetical protein
MTDWPDLCFDCGEPVDRGRFSVRHVGGQVMPICARCAVRLHQRQPVSSPSTPLTLREELDAIFDEDSAA